MHSLKPGSACAAPLSEFSCALSMRRGCSSWFKWTSLFATMAGMAGGTALVVTPSLLLVDSHFTNLYRPGPYCEQCLLLVEVLLLATAALLRAQQVFRRNHTCEPVCSALLMRAGRLGATGVL
jgi:hypothetical protein